MQKKEEARAGKNIGGCEMSGWLPPSYAGMADAFAEYDEARRSGFDRGIKEFLAMKREEIDDGNDEAIIDHALERLFERGRYSIIERVCNKWRSEIQ